jgi:tRNA-dihydrouridine synthase B
MIRPLAIGNLSFENNLIQGPLAGYSCAPFRRLFYRFQPPAYCCTEMISAQDLLTNKNSKKRFTFRDPLEKYLCYQLGGYDIHHLRDAAKYAVDCGADLIDINCGCPKPKIRKKRMGSYLLDYPDHICKIIEAIKDVISVPVTAKIRIMKPDVEKENTLQTVKMITEAGADAIIVHGRNWSEDYMIPCHLEAIAEIVESTKIPIIGNGDVGDIDSLNKMFAITQCAGVMISRAGTGKPWIYEQILMQAKGEEFTLPSLSTVKSLFLEHIEKLVEIENESSAFLQSRNIFKYYFGKKVSDENFVAYCALKNIQTIPRFLELIDE